MKRLLVAGLLLISSAQVAYGAIPPPPQEETPTDEPATENPTPDDPTAQPDMEVDQPDNRPTGDTTSTNTPPKEWYTDMHKQLYQMQQYTYQMKTYNYSYEINYYADWMYLVLDKLYNSTYDSYGQPKKYSWGYPTRGDYNHVYYYWIRPLYKKVLYYSSQYYAYSNPYYHAQYKYNVKPFYNAYHSLTRCMYGKNGADLQAEDDTELADLEKQAGFGL